MTQSEKDACNRYLDELDKTHTSNEYKLIKELLDEQVPSNDNKALIFGMFVLLLGAFIFGVCLHISGVQAIQSGRYTAAANDYIFGMIFIIISSLGIYEIHLRSTIEKWISSHENKSERNA